MQSNTKPPSHERLTWAIPGWPMLVVNFVLFIGGSWLFAAALYQASQSRGGEFSAGQIVLGIALFLLAGVSFRGHFTLQPNEARVLLLFGTYKGTVRAGGFWWANPLCSRLRGVVPSGFQVQAAGGGDTTKTVGALQLATMIRAKASTKISLRARNFVSEQLKVNDKRGNPVEIAAVIVWRVEDTAQAVFDVEDYENYVTVQAESAMRHIASLYPYDHGEEHEPTLRSSADDVAQALTKELQECLSRAGVVVEETRLTHLAYAPEIAQLMLRRQQAEAVIAARQVIVKGAVSMVEMALHGLAEKGIVDLDEERKAAMVSNLLVVLCGESQASPVINTGTLYS